MYERLYSPAMGYAGGPLQMYMMDVVMRCFRRSAVCSWITFGILAGLLASEASAVDFMIPEKGRLYSVEGKPVSVSDLSPAARQALYDATFQYYEHVRGILDQNLLNEHIQAVAKKEEKSADDIEAELFSATVSEKEAMDWYALNKERLGGRSFESIKNDLNLYLSRQKTESVKEQVLKTIKQEKKFTLALHEPEVPQFDIRTAGYPAKGSQDSKITVVAFADYRCPHCREASHSLKKVIEKFQKQVRFVYLDFPLSDEGVSVEVAKGAVCADLQGKFWAYHDQAFEDQKSLTMESPYKIAENMKLQMDPFKKCLKDPKTIEKILKSRDEGQRIGVQGTPAVYVNGRRVVGYSEESLERAIRKYL